MAKAAAETCGGVAEAVGIEAVEATIVAGGGSAAAATDESPVRRLI